MKLSNAGVLIPPALAFSFDRDGRSDIEMRDIIRQSRGRVHFLPRRMIESYFVDPDAITAVFSEALGETAIERVDQVRTWLSQQDIRFLPKQFHASDMAEKLRETDGANLLRALFSELSEGRLNYDKVLHGTLIMKWLIQNRPDVVRELAEYLGAILDTPSQPQSQ